MFLNTLENYILEYKDKIKLLQTKKLDQQSCLDCKWFGDTASELDSYACIKTCGNCKANAPVEISYTKTGYAGEIFISTGFPHIFEEETLSHNNEFPIGYHLCGRFAKAVNSIFPTLVAERIKYFEGQIKLTEDNQLGE